MIASSVFAGCQIPYPKREFLNEDEPEEKTEKVIIHLDTSRVAVRIETCTEFVREKTKKSGHREYSDIITILN